MKDTTKNSSPRKLVAAYGKDFYSKPDPFQILAFVVDACNYNCEYCYNHFPRTSKRLDLAKLEAFVYEAVFGKMRKKTLSLDLIGGETLTHAGLLPFCRKLASDSRIETTVYSNFSFPLEQYQDLLDSNVHLILSWHSCCDHADFREKFKKLVAGGRLSQISLSVMYEHNAPAACLEAFDWFSSNFPGMFELEFSILGQNENYFGMEYTKKQFQDFLDRAPKTKTPTTKLVYSDGSSELVNDNYFFRDPANANFSRWICNAGLDFLFVYFDGSVHPCDENDNTVIFNIETGDPKSFVPPSRPVFCRRDYCPCLFDLYKKRAFV